MYGCGNVIVMAETLNYLMALLKVRIFRFGLCAASVYGNTTLFVSFAKIYSEERFIVTSLALMGKH